MKALCDSSGIRNAGGRLFQVVGPLTAKLRCHQDQDRLANEGQMASICLAALCLHSLTLFLWATKCSQLGLKSGVFPRNQCNEGNRFCFPGVPLASCHVPLI